ncbi:MAG: class I SAM-dependent methyltransferase [Phenylobacterium sp.]|uniref:class I SAM-dependent methyltransferase n=1 Tax=Phenylobacterium sp. TaxID=1871053 RepID=UPI00391D535F
MKPSIWLAAVAALALSTNAFAAPAPHLTAAVADASRPDADKARDTDRKPAEVLDFAGVKPGDKVVDFIPGGGYFTRVLAKAVGPQGKVYAAAPPASSPDAQPAAAQIAAEPGYGNVQVIPLNPGAFAAPEPVDVIFTAQNYHDLHLKRLNVDVPAANKSLFDALKPGGVLLVVDHAAVAGAPLEVADTLHRIDPAKAKSEIEAAGFVFEGESDVLRNPDDPKTASVFDPAIRGKTDQFVYRFRRPS